jgi:hypothetical protein
MCCPLDMHSWADQHRRRAIEARQRAAQASEPSVKAGFAEIADHWLALAEAVDWLERGFATVVPRADAPAAPMQQQQQIQPKPK